MTNNRRTTGATGAKLLLSASALGLTMGGWALLASAESPVPAVDSIPTADYVLDTSAAQGAPGAPGISDLPPIPTVVPLYTPAEQRAAPVDRLPAAVEAAPAPVLREVPSAPAPQPVARTRSSS